MNTRASFSDNTLRIKSSRLIFWIVTLLGILMLGMGFYLLGRPVFPSNHLLIGCGLIFSAGGLLFFMNSEYHKIHINEDPGFMSILESSNRAIVPLKVPIKYFTCINLQQNISKIDSSRTSFKYEIYLLSQFGSSLFLAQYDSKKKAMEFAERLQGLMKIRLEYDKVLLDEGKKYDSVLELDLPVKASLRKESKGNQVNLTWKSKYNLVHFILFGTMLYGSFHLFHFVIIPGREVGILAPSLYGLIVILSVLLIIAMIYNLFGFFKLEISPNGIRYYKKIFGRKTAERTIPRSEISLLRNTINMGTDGIAIINKDGVNIIQRIGEAIKSGDNNPSRFFSLTEDMSSFRDEIFSLNTASLSLTEKLIIENEILKMVR